MTPLLSPVHGQDVQRHQSDLQTPKSDPTEESFRNFPSVMTQIGTFHPFSLFHFEESSIEINGLVVTSFLGIEIAFPYIDKD